MEMILDFLSEYYVWFFVAAGVLVFALIGFLVQSKKKKDEPEHISEPVETQTMTPTQDVKTTTEESQPPVMENIPVEEIKPIPEEPVVEQNTEISNVMPINDVPVKEQTNFEQTEKLEFLGEVTTQHAPTEPTLDEIKPVHEFNSQIGENITSTEQTNNQMDNNANNVQ